MSNKNESNVSVKEILLCVFSMMPLVVMMYISSSLPDKCVIGVSITKVCYYGSKNVLWWLSLVPIVFEVCVMAYLRSGKKKVKQNANVQRIALSVIVFMIGYMAALLFRCFDLEIIDIYNLVCFSISILFATVGSALLKDDNPLKVKNVWTIDNERLLKKINMLVGNMCVGGGLIQALGAVVLERKYLFYVMILVFMVCLFAPNVMAYVWYKKNKN